jgi:predicted enzyme related to lactoylglutathione lyase
MTLDLFAEIPVTDYPAALAWYEKFFGYPPAFAPHDKESVWELAEHRYVVVVELPARAGRALTTIFVDDLDERVTGISRRGLEPTKRETYGNGVRKVTYHDPEGNEFGLGGGPVETGQETEQETEQETDERAR